MKTVSAVLTSWLLLVSVLALALVYGPSTTEFSWIGFSINSLQILLFILSILVVKKETVRKNKPIFVNFAILFSLTFLFQLQFLFGAKFDEMNKFFSLYFQQYVGVAGYFVLLAFALVYVTMDALFREWSSPRKYALTMVIVGGFFLLYFSPYLADPKHVYHSPDVYDFSAVDKVEQTLAPDPNQLAPLEAITAAVELPVWHGTERVGLLGGEAKAQRVAVLYQYLPGRNYLILVYRDLYMKSIYMCVLAISFIFLFFGYQYMKDPPQGAYIEKIMFLFLVFCSMEVLHAWLLVKNIEWTISEQLVSMGQYMSLSVLFLIAFSFAMRLRFISSVKGEFYEQELATRPAGITRWRDAVDDLVLANFFNRKAVIGRMLVDPERKL